MSRSLVAGALAAVVALGVTAPAAAAAPKDGHSHVFKAQVHKAKVVKAQKGGKATVKAAKAKQARIAKAKRARIAKAKQARIAKAKQARIAKANRLRIAKANKVRAAKAAQARAAKSTKVSTRHTRVAQVDRRTLRLQRHLTRHVDRKERWLTWLVESRWVTSLPADQRMALTLNISTDLSELADLETAIAAGEDLRTLAWEVHGVRPEVYLSTLVQLRWAERLREEVLAVGLETTELDAAVATLLGFDARTSRRDLWNAKRALVAVKQAVEAAEDALEQAPEPTPEAPVTEEPVVGDPVLTS